MSYSDIVAVVSFDQLTEQYVKTNTDLERMLRRPSSYYDGLPSSTAHNDDHERITEWSSILQPESGSSVYSFSDEERSDADIDYSVLELLFDTEDFSFAN